MRRLTIYHEDLSVHRADPKPYDHEVHDWHIPMEESNTLSSTFDFVEEALTANNQELLKKGVLGQLRKDSELALINERDLELSGVSIAHIQEGAQLGIFKVEAFVDLYGIIKQVNLIAGVSRHPDLNPYIQKDHQSIEKLRSDEARSHGLAEDSEAYNQLATFPEHFGEYEANGRYLYLGEFCEGYAEVNLLCKEGERKVLGDKTSRLIGINRLNQSASSYLISEEASSEVLKEIMVHQVRSSVQSMMLLHPRFRAGDYMYHPEKQRLMLQCYRHEDLSDGWSKILSNSLKINRAFGKSDPKGALLAYQIMKMVTSNERNLEAITDNPPPGQFFSYCIQSLREVIGQLKKDQSMLSHQNWDVARHVFAYLAELAGSMDREKILDHLRGRDHAFDPSVQLDEVKRRANIIGHFI